MRTGGWLATPVLCWALVAAACESGGEIETDDVARALAFRHGPPPSPLRLLSPLSSAIATSQRPMFRWVGHERQPVLVEVCRDRGCADRIMVFLGFRGAARPPRALPAGTAYWRVIRIARGRLSTSNVWQLVVPARDSGRSGAWGSVPDFNGDGFSDLAVTVKGARWRHASLEAIPCVPTEWRATAAPVA